MSTIAAISTPLEAGGLAVIRMTGEKSFEIADEIFAPFDKIPPSKMAGHTCSYGRIVREGQTLDDVVLTVFRAPKSYTGLDTVEISCHGGVYLAKQILRLLLEKGAAPAGPGEFTKLDFLNGKIGLTQAESVMDIISAEGDATLKSARLMREGRLYQRIKSVSDKLVSALSSLAAWCDYPDEDVPETDFGSIEMVIADSQKVISQILNDYDTGRILRAGIDTAIIGKPNVGKSTLMNALLGYERSIVTDTMGTTRDVVEEAVKLGDITLRLSDTAGIRETCDKVESIGVARAKRKLDEAELIIAVIDGSRVLDDSDFEILKSLKNRRHIVVINKADLPQKIDLKYINNDNILFVSANTGEGIEKITEKINELFKLGGHSDGGAIFANERQRALCERAGEFLDKAKEAIAAGITLDGVTIYIEEAANSLLTLTGEKATEAVVNDVFSRFCVGK